MTRPKIEIDPLELYGAICMFMSKLYDDTHTKERTAVSQFLCEMHAKNCVSYIKDIIVYPRL